MKTTTAKGNGAGPLSRENVERMWAILRSTPKSRAYPALGAVLALGTPAGLLLTSALATGRVPTFAWALAEIARLPVTYAYLTLSTVAVLAVFGYLFGRLFDRLLLLSNADPSTGSPARRAPHRASVWSMVRPRKMKRAAFTPSSRTPRGQTCADLPQPTPGSRLTSRVGVVIAWCVVSGGYIDAAKLAVIRRGEAPQGRA